MGKTAKAFVTQALQWEGLKESNNSQRQIIDVYNKYRPLPRGYAVKYHDAWCATFVSAVSIKLGFTDIIPPECSCIQMINQFKKLGVWRENENYIPRVGDICFYDWQDTGVGDNKGQADHVGIVVESDGHTFKVLEGNYNNAVKKRTLAVNAKCLRGFAIPKYDIETQKIHVVKSGDTLSKLAIKYGCTVEEILSLNKDLIKNKNLIKIGWKIKIP